MLASHFNMAAATTTSVDDRLGDPAVASSTTTASSSSTSSASTGASPGASSVQHHQPTNIRELLWEERAKTLRELVSNYRLPLAVKLKSGSDAISPLLNSPQTHSDPPTVNGIAANAGGLKSSPVKFFGSRDAKDGGSRVGREADEIVLQIHETRRKKIILARKMTWEKRQNDYVVTGEQVEIPASFKGWLEVVPDDGRPVEYFDTVGGITSVKPKRFLVRTSTVGYQLTAEEGGASCWMPTEIRPGEVLTTGIIYMDNKRGTGGRTGTQRNIFKRLLKHSKPKREQELKYLQCFQATGQEIMIPLIMSGVFSPVGDASMANYDAVYELQDLIMAFGLPVNAQLIHVNGQESFPCPRGVIRLYGTREEELVVVSRVGRDGTLTYSSGGKTQGGVAGAGEGIGGEGGEERFEIPIEKEALFRRGVVKKKPAIKANLVEVFKTLPERDKVKAASVEEDRGHRDSSKGYFRSQSHNEFKLRNANDRKLTTPSTVKAKPLVTSYNEKHLRSVCDEYRDTLFKDSGQKSPTYSSSASQPTSPLKMPTSDPVTIDNSLGSGMHSPEKTPEQPVSKEVELPEKAPKELKKSKSTGLLDKLSVRRAKKERAKLKELKGDDVFSRRISRSDVSYQDFFNGQSDDENSGNAKKEEGEKKGETDLKEKITANNTSGSLHSTPSTAYGSKGGDSDRQSKSSKETPGGDNKTLSLAQKRHSNMQNRDLPPIPPESPEHDRAASPSNHINISKESLYEHLPPAPPTPTVRRASEPKAYTHHKNKNHTNNQHQNHNHNHHDPTHKDNDHEDDDDGYMTPMQFQQDLPAASSYSRNRQGDDIQMRSKPRTGTSALHDSLSRASRSRRVRSELPREFVHRHNTYDDDCPLDIDDLFSFAYGGSGSGGSRTLGDQRPFSTLGDPRPLSSLGAHPTVSTSQLYGAARVPAWRPDFPSSNMLDQRFVDNLDLETHSGNQGQTRSRNVNMNANPNATIRSHNLRKFRPNAMEVFHFTDSFRDVREPPQSPMDQNLESGVPDSQSRYSQNLYDPQPFYTPASNNSSNSRPPLLNSRSVDGGIMSSLYLQQQKQQQQQQQQQQRQQLDIYGHPYGAGVTHYADSEPCYRPNHRAASVGGVSETFASKPYIDDSMCSRGDGGFPNESEYSYNEYLEQVREDDGWTPSGSVEGMSVLEVSKSLRYIGMKDRVVLRFSNEQIDGSMLCTLDKKLLKEGFPELNALEVKKILDFVQGWRPKKK